MTDTKTAGVQLNQLAKKLNIEEVHFKTNSIFINGEVPSKKNSKQWTGKTLISSKATLRYEKTAGYEYVANRSHFIKQTENYSGTLYVGMYFIRKTKRIFDYNNIGQTVLDMLVSCGWLQDDNASNVVPVFLGHHTDAKNAGVFVYLLSL